MAVWRCSFVFVRIEFKDGSTLSAVDFIFLFQIVS